MSSEIDRACYLEEIESAGSVIVTLLPTRIKNLSRWCFLKLHRSEVFVRFLRELAASAYIGSTELFQLV